MLKTFSDIFSRSCRKVQQLNVLDACWEENELLVKHLYNISRSNSGEFKDVLNVKLAINFEPVFQLKDRLFQPVLM